MHAHILMASSFLDITATLFHLFFSLRNTLHQIQELFLETSSCLIFPAQYSAVVSKFIPWSALCILVG